MTKIAYLLLCHQDPGRVITQVTHLVAQGDFVALHFDARGSRQDFDKIKNAFRGHARVHIVKRRVKCGWGEWSLVRATLNTLRDAYQHFDAATHFYLISGDCMPIRSAIKIKEALVTSGCDYIEHHDFYDDYWINTGVQQERLIYRHFFNERRQKWLYDAAQNLQKRIGLVRDVPDGLTVRIGSQWWCLRRSTVQRVLKFTRRNFRIVQFFKTTWIPDEIYFQTIVPRLIPASEIKNCPPTLLQFSNYGMPISFYPDHYDFLIKQDAFFARKIGAGSLEFLQKLWDLYASHTDNEPRHGTAKEIIAQVQSAGRAGLRFGPRFFEQSRRLRADQSLTIIVTRDRTLPDRLAACTSLGFVFDADSAAVCDDLSVFAPRAERLAKPALFLSLLCCELPSDQMIAFLDPEDVSIFTDLSNFRGQLGVIFDHGVIPTAPRFVGVSGTGIDDQLSTQLQNGLARTIRQVKCDHNGRVFDVPANLTRDAAVHWIAARITKTED